MEENTQQNNGAKKKNNHRHFYHHHNRSKQGKEQINKQEIDQEVEETLSPATAQKQEQKSNNPPQNSQIQGGNNGNNRNNHHNRHNHKDKNSRYNRSQANAEAREEMTEEELEQYRSSVVLNLVNEKKAEMAKEKRSASVSEKPIKASAQQMVDKSMFDADFSINIPPMPTEEKTPAVTFDSKSVFEFEKLANEDDYKKEIAKINVDDLLSDLKKKDAENMTRAKVTVCGINFRGMGKTYYFDPGNLTLKPHDHVIVETARGMEYADVVKGNMEVYETGIVSPLKPVLRLADKNDEKTFEENLKKEKLAFPIFKEKVKECNLEMQLFDVRYAFNGSSIVFYFSADGRVDFRELVRMLASEFHTRIELRQIGCRDEAKMLGGLGACGRTLCCANHLPNYLQTTVKMAKEQGLSINSSKISGTCGRLLCCLQYESSLYTEALKFCPSVGDFVKSPEGNGKVTSVSPLQGICKVSIHNKENDTDTIKQFDCVDIQVLSHEKEKFDKNEGKELEGN